LTAVNVLQIPLVLGAVGVQSTINVGVPMEIQKRQFTLLLAVSRDVQFVAVSVLFILGGFASCITPEVVKDLISVVRNRDGLPTANVGRGTLVVTSWCLMVKEGSSWNTASSWKRSLVVGCFLMRRFITRMEQEMTIDFKILNFDPDCILPDNRLLTRLNLRARSLRDMAKDILESQYMTRRHEVYDPLGLPVRKEKLK
jgi:hypothetical protein